MKDLGLSSPYATIGLLMGFLLFVGLGFFTAIASPPETFSEDFFSPVEQVSEYPCYEVTIDESLLVNIGHYKSGNFGENELRAENLFTKDFKADLAASLIDATWNKSNTCFEGSFILSFEIAEDGTLGSSMLAHHISGGAGMSSQLATTVLIDLEAKGHRWHNGQLPAGEVQLPVAFRMN